MLQKNNTKLHTISKKASHTKALLLNKAFNINPPIYLSYSQISNQLFNKKTTIKPNPTNQVQEVLVFNNLKFSQNLKIINLSITLLIVFHFIMINL